VRSFYFTIQSLIPTPPCAHLPTHLEQVLILPQYLHTYSTQCTGTHFTPSPLPPPTLTHPLTQNRYSFYHVVLTRLGLAPPSVESLMVEFEALSLTIKSWTHEYLAHLHLSLASVNLFISMALSPSGRPTSEILLSPSCAHISCDSFVTQSQNTSV